MQNSRLPLLLLVLAAALPGPLAAQDPTEPAAPRSDGEIEAQPPADAGDADETDADEEEQKVRETDDESYLDIEEKDFTPSEEIPTDQSIAFPVDI